MGFFIIITPDHKCLKQLLILLVLFQISQVKLHAQSNDNPYEYIHSKQYRFFKKNP